MLAYHLKHSKKGSSKKSDSPFIHESSNRVVYVIGLEARRTGKHLLD